MSEEYQLTLNDYKDIIKRRWLFFLIPFVVVACIGVLVAMVLPAVYESKATILVESQQIPKDLIRSTITSYADERIQVIQQRVMTRDNLMAIIEKFNLFAKEKDKMTASEMVFEIKSRISVAKTAINKNNRRAATIAFNISFEDSNPAIAHAVANELVTLFLDENVKSRTERASETTEFLADEARKLKKSLETIEEQLASFKQENSDALPEHLQLHLTMAERAEAMINEIRRDIKTAEEENRFLEIELSVARRDAKTIRGNEIALSPEEELNKLEIEYSGLITQFTEAHPDVKAIKRKMALLQKEISENGGSPNNASEGSIEIARVRARIDSVNEKIKSLNVQLKEQEEERDRLEKVIIKTPQVQRALVSLNRDYENTLKKFKEIQSKEMEAKLAESLEEEKKAEKFTLIEPPIKPDKPIKPNRKKVIAFGLILAAGFGGGLVFLLEMLDKRVRGERALTSILRHRPLVSVPIITTQSDIRRRKRRLVILVSLVMLAGILSVAMVHIFYMPLDLLLLKLMVKVG